jgi:hypothetical protein
VELIFAQAWEVNVENNRGKIVIHIKRIMIMLNFTNIHNDLLDLNKPLGR